MKLTLAEPKYLKDSIAIISDLVSEAMIKINKNAIEIVAMDPANIAMVIFKQLSSSFTEFKVEEDVEIGINLATFKQFLRRAKLTDMLTLELEENKLKILLKGNTTRTFYLPIIDLEEKEQRIPDLSFPITITMNPSILSEAIEDADIVAESVAFEMNESKFVISAEGDLSKAKIEVKEGDDCKIVSDVKEIVKSKYSVEYLKKMISGSKVADEVVINFNKDYPLKMEFKSVDKLTLSFILAPRVEND